MGKGLTIFTIAAALLGTAALANATFIDSEGSSGSGLNNTAASAQSTGSLGSGNDSITIHGWIDSSNPDDVDFFAFQVTGTLDVYLDIDYADDFGSANDSDTGVDTVLAVFDASSTLIAYNDDNKALHWDSTLGQYVGTTPDPGSEPFGDYDSFIGALTLGPGTYYAAVSSSGNDPQARWPAGGLTCSSLSISGESCSGAPTGNDSYDMAGWGYTSGQYQLQVRLDPVGAPIPEPAAMLLFGTGLAGLAGARLRRKNNRRPR